MQYGFTDVSIKEYVKDYETDNTLELSGTSQ